MNNQPIRRSLFVDIKIIAQITTVISIILKIKLMKSKKKKKYVARRMVFGLVKCNANSDTMNSIQPITECTRNVRRMNNKQLFFLHLLLLRFSE